MNLDSRLRRVFLCCFVVVIASTQPPFPVRPFDPASQARFTNIEFPKIQPPPQRPRADTFVMPPEPTLNILPYLQLRVSSLRSDTHRNSIDYYTKLAVFKKQLDSVVEYQSTLPQPPMDVIDPILPFVFQPDTNTTISAGTVQIQTFHGQSDPSSALRNSTTAATNTSSSNTSTSTNVSSSRVVAHMNASEAIPIINSISHQAFLSVINIIRLKPSSETAPRIVAFRFKMERLIHLQSVLSQYKGLILQKRHLLENTSIVLANNKANANKRTVAQKLQRLAQLGLPEAVDTAARLLSRTEQKYKNILLDEKASSIADLLRGYIKEKNLSAIRLNDFSSTVGRQYLFNLSDFQSSLLKKYQQTITMADEIITSYGKSTHELVVLNKELTATIDNNSEKISINERLFPQLLKGLNYSDTAFNTMLIPSCQTDSNLQKATEDFGNDLQRLFDSYYLLVVQGEVLLDRLESKNLRSVQLKKQGLASKIYAGRALVEETKPLAKALTPTTNPVSIMSDLSKYDSTVEKLDKVLTELRTYITYNQNQDNILAGEQTKYSNFINGFPNSSLAVFNKLEQTIQQVSELAASMETIINKNVESTTDPHLKRILENHQIRQLDARIRNRPGQDGVRSELRRTVGPVPPFIIPENPVVQFNTLSISIDRNLN